MKGYWFSYLTSPVLVALRDASKSKDLMDRDRTLTEIESLNLSECRLASVPSFIKDMPNLKDLDLSNNNIGGSLDGSVFSTNLESLDLSNNEITSFSFDKFSPGSLQRLSHINLDNNRLTKFPEKVYLAQGLISLRAGWNSLVAVPDDLRLPESLKDLYLKNNQIASVDACTKALSQCYDLNLANNKISKIPVELFSGNIGFLDIEGNVIEDWEFMIEASRRGADLNM